MHRTSINRRSLFILMVLSQISLASSFGYAATGEPTVFRVTMKQVEASKDAGSTYVTVGEGDQAINIAGVSAGAVASSYVSAPDIATGTYNRLRVTIANTIGLQGSLEQDAGMNIGTIFYTQAGTSAGSTSSGDLAEFTFTVTSAPPGFALDVSAGTMTSTETVSIEIQENQATTVQVSFDVGSGLVLNADNTFSPGTPTVTITSS